ncbi:hypothetical protein [Enhygromyxa salina]|uniref:hypothetical protein n=1 Tax=Enhygromyxa salina TaxID=215803 RepID=UPI0011BA8F6C|nr:hypothetical protein [Enhygromyxa salina]
MHAPAPAQLRYSRAPSWSGLWAWVLVFGVMLVLAPSRARAGDPSCSEPVEQWVRSCAESTGQPMSAISCPAGMLIISAAAGEATELRVEVRRPAGHSMATIDDVGVSPIGEFPRWADAPAPLQAAFAAVVECARAGPVPTLASGAPRPRHAPIVAAPRSTDDASPDRLGEPEVAPAEAPPTPAPWLGLAGLLVMAGVVWRARPPLRTRESYVALGLALTCAALQSILPWSFFLQNGHGPQWVEFALRGHDGLAEYGPGYPELLAAVVRLGAGDPESALAWAYLGLGVVLSVSIYAAARAVGARPVCGFALVVIVALDPTVVRLIRSASYHAPVISLQALAAALLVLAARRTSARAPTFVVAVIGAGLMIAQSARVHPVGWLAAAVLPTVIMFVPGHSRTRVGQTLLATAVIAVVVAATSLSELSRPLNTPIGRGSVDPSQLLWTFGLSLLALGVGVALVLRRPTARARTLLIAGILGVIVVIAVRLNPVAVDAMRYQAGYFACFAPVLGLGLASLAARLVPGRRHQRIAAAVALGVAALASLATASERVRPATDARESTWALEWRARDWGVARVVYIREVDTRAVVLPLHARGSLRGTGLRAADVSAFYLGEPVLYYRSSLCSEAAGREACSDLESRLHIEDPAVLEREFPAIASQPWHPLQADSVRVGLFMARPRQSPDSP